MTFLHAVAVIDSKMILFCIDRQKCCAHSFITYSLVLKLLLRRLSYCLIDVCACAYTTVLFCAYSPHHISQFIMILIFMF